MSNSSSPDDPNRTIVGFLPFDTRRVELPFDVSIDTGSIGGPAGLAFTLTVIDGLSDGELTGGRRVAVTGTIDLDGSVGISVALLKKHQRLSKLVSNCSSFRLGKVMNGLQQRERLLQILRSSQLQHWMKRSTLVAFGGERPNPPS